MLEIEEWEKLNMFPLLVVLLVFWLVELDFFSLECNEVSSNKLWDISGFGVTLGSLYVEDQGCVPVLLENWLGMSCPGTCWPLGGAWFQCVWRHFGEGNGNPLQYSCMENPKDVGAWWAAIYGVAQSWTRLKQLSSSSSSSMEAFDELLSLNVPWSQVFYNVLRICT